NYPEDDSWEPEHLSLLGPGLLVGADQPAPIFTAAESYLLQSEAAFKGLLDGDAKALYESGIDASFSLLGAGSGSSYYSQSLNNVSWDASTNKLEAITTQKWIALNGINAWESWMEYNRTGFPSNLPVSLLASTPERPVRLAYPSTEITRNGSNVPAQPNVFTEKQFWAN